MFLNQTWKKISNFSLVIFKHLLQSNYLIFKSFRSSNKSQFENNLFNNTQIIRLSSIFNKIRSTCTKNRNCHYWGTILSMKHFNFKLKVINKTNLKANLNVENLLIEYWPEILKSLLGRLNAILEKIKQFERNDNVQRLQKNHLSIKINLKSIHFYYLYQDIYLISLTLNNFNLINVNENNSLIIDKINCLEFNTDEIRPVKENIVNNKFLNASFIEYFREEDENNEDDIVSRGSAKSYNLLFLVKIINLTKVSNDYYICINDILLTWSLQIHFIIYDTLVKPFDQYKSLVQLITNSGNFRGKKPSFNLNLLIESNILINFLFDYQQDSSKTVLPSNLTDGLGPNVIPYFNTAHPTNSLIHTVSILLNSAYFSKQSDTICASINDISVLINVDDQNIFSILNSFNEDSCILHSTSKLREFIKIKQIEANYFTPEKSLLRLERQHLNTEQKLNHLVSVNFDILSLNFLFNYDFAKLFDHLLNLRKCLYIIHDKRPQVSNESNLISSDLLIKIKHFQMSIEDDPFEVRLAYNYALMTDEHFESVKRRQTLEQRRSIKEQNLELEALEILRERESKVTILGKNVYFYFLKLILSINSDIFTTFKNDLSK